MEHLEQFDAAIRHHLWGLLCGSPALSEIQTYADRPFDSFIIELHNIIGRFNAMLSPSETALAIEPELSAIKMMRTDATRMVRTYRHLPAFHNELHRVKICIAELGYLRVLIARTDAAVAITPLRKLPTVLPLALRVDIVQSTLDAFSPLALVAFDPGKIADDWMAQVVGMLRQNQHIYLEDIYMVELMRRTLLACTPAAAAALIRFISSTKCLVYSSFSRDEFFAILSRPDAGIGGEQNLRSWMRVVVSMGDALEELQTRASDGPDPGNAQHNPFSTSARPTNSNPSGLGLLAGNSEMHVLKSDSARSKEQSAVLGDASTRSHMGGLQTSKGLSMRVRLFPQDALMSLREMSREAIWVAMLAAADGQPLFTNRRCTLHDAFGQLGLPSLLFYYLEFL